MSVTYVCSQVLHSPGGSHEKTAISAVLVRKVFGKAKEVGN